MMELSFVKSFTKCILFRKWMSPSDPSFVYPEVQNSQAVTKEESFALYGVIKDYLKSDIVDEEAASSGEQVLDSDSIINESDECVCCHIVTI